MSSLRTQPIWPSHCGAQHLVPPGNRAHLIALPNSWAQLVSIFRQKPVSNPFQPWNPAGYTALTWNTACNSIQPEVLLECADQSAAPQLQRTGNSPAHLKTKTVSHLPGNITSWSVYNPKLNWLIKETSKWWNKKPLSPQNGTNAKIIRSLIRWLTTDSKEMEIYELSEKIFRIILKRSVNAQIDNAKTKLEVQQRNSNHPPHKKRKKKKKNHTQKS